MKIEYYDTNLGKFLKIVGNYYTADAHKSIVSIDGKLISELKPASNGWYIWQGELKNFKKLQPAQKVHVGYKLTNPSLESKFIPGYISAEEANDQYDEDLEKRVWQGQYQSLESLYEAVFETKEQEVVDFDVEVVKLRDLEIESYEKPSEMKIQEMVTSGFRTVARELDLSSVVEFSELDKMLTPEFMLHTRPCSLSSQQVYRIVRKHIIENIDSKVAKITSNYEFCFTVKRLVQTKVKPYSVEQRNSKGNSYRPPRFKTAYSSAKEVEIFEMTWKGYNGNAGYNGYTCIDSWSASSLQELYDNMQKYLSDLMEVINKSVVECSYCNGTGCSEVSKIGTNQREVV